MESTPGVGSTFTIELPAAAARRLSNNPETMALAAAGLACIAVVSGLLMSAFANAITGPAIVLSAGLLFVLTLLRPQAN